MAICHTPQDIPWTGPPLPFLISADLFATATSKKALEGEAKAKKLKEKEKDKEAKLKALADEKDILRRRSEELQKKGQVLERRLFNLEHALEEKKPTSMDTSVSRMDFILVKHN